MLDRLAAQHEHLQKFSASHFKRADLGRFLGIVVVARNNNNIVTKSRSELSRPGYVSNVPLLQGQNDHDVFIDLEGALVVK